MRFAHRRYYVERYIKCDCCGVLIYDAGIAAAAPDGSRTPVLLRLVPRLDDAP